MSDPLQTFQKIAGAYLNANSFQFQPLKQDLERNTDKDWPDLFKTGLHAAIHEAAISREGLEPVLDLEFDSDEHMTAWLTEVWRYLYEDGPEPS
jgi:hypothetical protein